MISCILSFIIAVSLLHRTVGFNALTALTTLRLVKTRKHIATIATVVVETNTPVTAENVDYFSSSTQLVDSYVYSSGGHSEALQQVPTVAEIKEYLIAESYQDISNSNKISSMEGLYKDSKVKYGVYVYLLNNLHP